jgi:lysozyme family protein|tara:strand:+ start:16478 stop:16963 length:486 start_codon:yes stop_codon:yes gene_type:complete
MSSDELYKIIARVIEREGGERLTNDPDDPGGITKWGISQVHNPSLDVPNLTLQEAVEVYRTSYWKKSKAYSLPDRLQEIYFDMVVNMGRKRAVMILQKACNHKGSKLAVDGGLGKLTLSACKKLEPHRLTAFRCLYYAELVTRKPTLMKYYYGWFRRSIEV